MKTKKIQLIWGGALLLLVCVPGGLFRRARPRGGDPGGGGADVLRPAHGRERHSR